MMEGAWEERLYTEEHLRGLPGGGAIHAGKVGASLAGSTKEERVLGTGHEKSYLPCFCWNASLEAPWGQRVLPSSQLLGQPPSQPTSPADTVSLNPFFSHFWPIVIIWIPESQPAAWFTRRETAANQPHLMGPNY